MVVLIVIVETEALLKDASGFWMLSDFLFSAGCGRTGTMIVIDFVM